MGRRYEIDEWAEFELEGYLEGEAQEREISRADIEYEVDPDLYYEQQKEFEAIAYEVVSPILEDLADAGKDEIVEEETTGNVDYFDGDDVAYNTWAVLSGSGGGNFKYKGRVWKAIHADKILAKAYAALEMAFIETVYDAAERAEGN